MDSRPTGVIGSSVGRSESLVQAPRLPADTVPVSLSGLIVQGPARSRAASVRPLRTMRFSTATGAPNGRSVDSERRT
jgi:hypothetical protein